MEESAWHLVAMRDDEVLGYGRLNAFDSRLYGISQMVVASAFQGQGVGRQILRKLIAIARDHGASKVQLSARTHAIPFYRQEGFETRGGALSIRQNRRGACTDGEAHLNRYMPAWGHVDWASG
ncbi:GNAT family N-acetyltransferase [Salinicola peritrichatus]|uniref:GNAT family N-acetyltransferase n=1 Tax=Salinicola peritrichatus TaxID=1267424 RepID=UPI000DA15A9D|nr:GNAT family N-acetyltransferase [Salinicola peritrichatus]